MAFTPILAAVLIGLVAGRIRRGRMSSLVLTRINVRILFVIAFVCGLAVDLVDVPRPGVWAVVGLAAGLAFAVRNIHLVGMVVIAVGVTANLLPVAINGATPVRADALVEAGMVDAADLDRVNLQGARMIADDDTPLDWMGDTIPVAAASQVVSFGDLVILIGLASVISNLMLQRRPRRVPKSALPSLETFGWHESPVGEGSIIELAADLRPVDPNLEWSHPDAERDAPRQLVGVGSMSSINPVQD